MSNWFATFLLLLSLTGLGCSSVPKGRVVETESRVLEAIGLAKNEPEARIAAVDKAIDYCSEKKQTPIFREDQLRGDHHGKHFDLDLRRIPMIGKVFKGEDKVQVILAFRCRSARA